MSDSVYGTDGISRGAKGARKGAWVPEACIHPSTPSTCGRKDGRQRPGTAPRVWTLGGKEAHLGLQGHSARAAPSGWGPWGGGPAAPLLPETWRGAPKSRSRAAAATSGASRCRSWTSSAGEPSAVGKTAPQGVASTGRPSCEGPGGLGGAGDGGGGFTAASPPAPASAGGGSTSAAATRASAARGGGARGAAGTNGGCARGAPPPTAHAHPAARGAPRSSPAPGRAARAPGRAGPAARRAGLEVRWAGPAARWAGRALAAASRPLLARRRRAEAPGSGTSVRSAARRGPGHLRETRTDMSAEFPALPSPDTGHARAQAGARRGSAMREPI